MTDAATGLRKALARAGSSVVTIAEMQADDILANLTDDQRTQLSAKLVPNASAGPAGTAPQAQAGDDGDRDDEMGEDGKPMKDKAGKKGKKDEEMGGADAEASAIATARAEGFAAATERAVTVLASEHCGGRAEQASKLLANPKLSADEIIGLLAALPDGDGDVGKLLAEIRSGNPGLGTGGGIDASQPKATDLWGKAYQSFAPKKPR